MHQELAANKTINTGRKIKLRLSAFRAKGIPMASVSAGKNARSATAISHPEITPGKKGRILPTSHSATRKAKGAPVAVGFPVQLPTAVSRKPATTAEYSRRSARGYASRSARSNWRSSASRQRQEPMQPLRRRPICRQKKNGRKPRAKKTDIYAFIRPKI